jgi:hypothetical protein
LKFFFKNKNTNSNIKPTFFKKNHFLVKIYNNKQGFFLKKDNFSNFFLKNGSLIKSRLVLGNLFKNLNNFLYLNKLSMLDNQQQTKSILNNLIEKKQNSLLIFDLITNLIKPPFIVKSVLIPKKLRKKTKQKYLVKIVYKGENKRLKSSYKQLYYYSNKFTDGSFKIRLYKSITMSFLD